MLKDSLRNTPQNNLKKLDSNPRLRYKWNISCRFMCLCTGFPDGGALVGGGDYQTFLRWRLIRESGLSGTGLVRAFWTINMVASHWAKSSHAISQWWAMSSRAMSQNKFFSGIWSQRSEKSFFLRQYRWSLPSEGKLFIFFLFTLRLLDFRAEFLVCFCSISSDPTGLVAA